MVEKLLSYLSAAASPGPYGGMVLGDGARLPGTDDIAHARALEQPHRVGDYLRFVVQRLIPSAERVRRGDVHLADYSGHHRAEDQLALRNSAVDLPLGYSRPARKGSAVLG